MTHDNIKSHRKPGSHPLFRRYIFWKTAEGRKGGEVKLTHPPGRFRGKGQGFQYNHHARSLANFVHRKVKTITFKLLPKTPENMLDMARHLGKAGKASALVSQQPIVGLRSFITVRNSEKEFVIK